jgi:hypothetical protein
MTATSTHQLAELASEGSVKGFDFRGAYFYGVSPKDWRTMYDTKPPIKNFVRCTFENCSGLAALEGATFEGCTIKNCKP